MYNYILIHLSFRKIPARIILRLFLLSISLCLLNGCASGPSKELLSTADYGSLPIKYEKIIKDFFIKENLASEPSSITVWTIERGYMSSDWGKPDMYGKRYYYYCDPSYPQDYVFGYVVVADVNINHSIRSGNWMKASKSIKYTLLIKNGKVIRCGAYPPFP